MIFTVIATGQSLTVDQVEYVRGKSHTVAISDAYKLAPWADVMASYDRKWWENNPRALDFEGLKFCAFTVGGVGFLRPGGMPAGCNSGLYGMYLANHIGASKIILLGFDMWGTHYFGEHKSPLANTTEKRFDEHIEQFRRWNGCEVINCTPGSELKEFQFGNLKEVLP